MIGNFDIINWIDGLLGKVTYGETIRFEMSRQAGWRGVDVESFLSSYGISVTGREICGDDSLAFCVNHRQAGWADYLLRMAGVPLLSKPLSDRNAAIPREGGKLPKPWGAPTKPKTFVDHTVRAMAWFLDAWEGEKDEPFWKRGR